MSTYRKPILIFGVIFQSHEEASKFCGDRFQSDELNVIELGLEYFDNDYWILGYQMEPGEMVDRYQMMWNAHCFGTKYEPKAMLDIREW